MVGICAGLCYKHNGFMWPIHNNNRHLVHSLVNQNRINKQFFLFFSTPAHAFSHPTHPAFINWKIYCLVISLWHSTNWNMLLQWNLLKAMIRYVCDTRKHLIFVQIRYRVVRILTASIYVHIRSHSSRFVVYDVQCIRS